MKDNKAMKSLSKIMNLVLPDCKEVAELSSISMDETLPLKKRMGLKLHIMLCKFCRRNNQQLYLIRNLIGKKLRNDEESSKSDSQSHLSEESRQRIAKVLKSGDISQS